MRSTKCFRVESYSSEAKVVRIVPSLGREPRAGYRGGRFGHSEDWRIRPASMVQQPSSRKDSRVLGTATPYHKSLKVISLWHATSHLCNLSFLFHTRFLNSVKISIWSSQFTDWRGSNLNTQYTQNQRIIRKKHAEISSCAYFNSPHSLLSACTQN